MSRSLVPYGADHLFTFLSELGQEIALNNQPARAFISPQDSDGVAAIILASGSSLLSTHSTIAIGEYLYWVAGYQYIFRNTEASLYLANLIPARGRMFSSTEGLGEHRRAGSD